MKNRLTIVTITMLLFICIGNAQYVFTGSIEDDTGNGAAYLSIVDDYRKISGVHAEQIISKTNIIDNTFEFKGNNLDLKNRIYRIHVDNCNENEQSGNHFNGHCDNSQEIIFIANNKDTIDLPISRNEQMFCSIRSTNKKSNAFFQIDSLKELMSYDYGNFRSEANRKLNNKKWFSTFQQFGEELKEPLAELYIYNFLSDRRSDLHEHYKKDITSNAYYNDLLERLQSEYPNTSYTQQYAEELKLDTYIKKSKTEFLFPWKLLLSVFLMLSVLLNLFLWNRFKKLKEKKDIDLTKKLTKQEQKIVGLLLENKTNKEIAQEVFVSHSTVKTHINNVYKKLNITSRDQVKSLFNK